MNHASSQRTLVLVALFVGCFAFSPAAQAVCQEGCDSSLFNAFLGDDALINNTTGTGNTALGWRSLFSNIDASFNTAIGGGALVLNNGTSNTATGAAALLLNTSGEENTATGTDALVFNDIGNQNTANGAFALFSNTEGTFNAATGHSALFSNTTGAGNTANGQSALFDNVAGDDNTAIGFLALPFNTGSNNIGLGAAAGFLMTTGDNVITIGDDGDSNAPDASDRCYIGNIRDVTTGNFDAVAVLIDSDGQLGTVSSSRRFKKDIKPMDQISAAILALKPVTFHYKDGDTKKAEETPQYGLIAEDVAAVNPDLIVRDKDGEIYSVRYDAVNVMLLNEFLKEHKRVEEQQANITQLNSKMTSQAAVIAQQQKGMEVLTAQLKEQAAQIQKVSAHLQLNSSAPKTVASDH